MADLSQLSTEDLMALKSGDLSKVSTQGLMALRGQPTKKAMPEPAFEREARQMRDTSYGDVIAGTPFFRMAAGMAEPFVGAAGNLGALYGRPELAESNKQYGQMEKRGKAYYGNYPMEGRSDWANKRDQDPNSIDLYKLTGAMAGPAPLAMAKLAPAATLGGKIAQGAGIGAGFGASHQIQNTEKPFAEIAGNTAVGGGIGGAIPLGIEGARAAISPIASGARNLADMLTPKGAERILTRYQDNITGEANKPAVIKALRGAPELVTGSKPTAAETLVGVPEGSPLVAHQKVTASTPGGISSQFGRRKLEQEEARKMAAELRNVWTTPMREKALEGANIGGVKTGAVIQKIDNMISKPGASTIAKKTLNTIKSDIEARSGRATNIDAQDLYTVRKEIGNTIATHAKETANWDKRHAATLEKDIQDAIDDAIESAGGNGWRNYLKEFANRSKAIEASETRSEMAFKPAQKTNLAGGLNVAEEVRTHAPQMLSRPMMLANFILRKLGHGVEPRIDAAAAARYLDPEKLAEALATAQGQQTQGKVIADILRRYAVPETMAIKEGVTQ